MPDPVSPAPPASDSPPRRLLRWARAGRTWLADGDGTGRWRAELFFALELVALCGLAITQPVLDVFADSPEWFVFRGATGAQINAFGALVAFGPPLVLWLGLMTLGLVDARLRRLLHLGAVAALGGVVALIGMKELAGLRGPPLVALAAMCGLVLAAATSSTGWVRTWLRYLAVADVAFVGIFVVQSPVGELARADGDVVVHKVRSDAPVIVLLYDEFPTITLLDDHGAIDASRFPNFARLAGDATWYRGFTGISGVTNYAVPTMLSGREAEKGENPFWYNYPNSLFTFFGGSHELRVWEVMTKVCAPELCGEHRGGKLQDGGDGAAGTTTSVTTDATRSTATGGTSADGASTTSVRPNDATPDDESPDDESPDGSSPRVVRRLLGDAVDIWSSVVAPSGAAADPQTTFAETPEFADATDTSTTLEHAPSTTLRPPPTAGSAIPTTPDTWGASGSECDVTAVSLPPAAASGDPSTIDTACDAYVFRPLSPDRQLLNQPFRFKAFLDSIEADEGAVLHYAHLLMPHRPWNLYPDGTPYEESERPATPVGAVRLDEDAAWHARVQRQRHVFQAVYADRLLGELIDRLEATGIYDRSLLVVGADHGVSFSPGQGMRLLTETNRSEIMYAPMFVKAPRQTDGARSDVNMSSVDLLPTIAGALGVDIPFAVWGQDAAAMDDGGPDKKRYRYFEDFIHDGNSVVEFDAAAGLREMLDAERFPAGDPRHGVAAGLYASSPYVDLVGQKVDARRVRAIDDNTRARVENLASYRSPSPDGPPAVLAGWLKTNRDTSGEWLAVSLDGTIGGVTPVEVWHGEAGAFEVVFDPSLLAASSSRVQLYWLDGPPDGPIDFVEIPIYD